MNGSILLLTKDAFCTSYLPCYGNSFWKGKTPNLDELVAKGTLFTNSYTAAPSSAMSYLSMFTMKYPYQQEIKTYIPVSGPYKGQTFFDKAYELGFSCHVVWDQNWIRLAQRYSECYGDHTKIHSLIGLRQPVGSHYIHESILQRNDQLAEETFEMFKKEIDSIMSSGKKVFLWCHLPHVLNGRTSYGDDIDLYDRYLGFFRQHFDDNNIFISGDHGNMNGQKGKLCYGFDVNENAIRIPLISPRIEGFKEYSGLFSNIDFFDLIMNREIKKRDVIYSDSAYYAQPHRKLAILKGKYRYIYNKKDKTEELYDIEWDPHEDMNLAISDFYDVDRKVTSRTREYYFYPYWDNIQDILKDFRGYKEAIWRDGDMRQNVYNQIYTFAARTYHRFKKIKTD